MISSREFMVETPAIFSSLAVAYGETRRDPESLDPISGNTSQSPSLGNVYEWLSPVPAIDADVWLAKEQKRAQTRLEFLYHTLAGRALTTVALSAPEHGTHLVDVDAEYNSVRYTSTSERTRGDATVTTKAATALVFNPADCPIINIAYPRNNSIAAISQIHAGAKGITDAIIGTTLSDLAQRGLSPRSAVAYVGPHNKSYSLYGAPLDRAKEHGLTPYLTPLEEIGHEHFDMAAAVVDQLTDAGVKAENIQVADVDTFLDTRYYSQRQQSTQAAQSQALDPTIPPFARGAVMFLKK